MKILCCPNREWPLLEKLFSEEIVMPPLAQMDAGLNLISLLC